MKDVFVARQPIFDARQNRVGYELLYRANASSNTASAATEAEMASSVIMNGVVGLGLDVLTEGQTAFIKLSEDMVLERAAELLDPDQVVLELLGTVNPTEQVIDACRLLTEKGYCLALEDFVYDEAFDPLLELAEVVKVDLIRSNGDGDVERILERLRPFAVRLLAKKVENKETHDRCVAQGFEFFQGYHYFRPETLTKKDLSTQTVAIIGLMNLLHDPGVTDFAIEEAFKADPGLTYKLLRIVNSAAIGSRGVVSIPHAMRLLGREPLHRWLCLLLMTDYAGGGEMHTEMVKAALVRGHMCETVCDVLRTPMTPDLPDAGSMFLVGLFSDMEMLLGMPVVVVVVVVVVTATARTLVREMDNSGEFEARRFSQTHQEETQAVRGRGHHTGASHRMILCCRVWHLK